MTLRELIDAVREILDDAVEEYLFTDETLTRHFNDAVSEVCIRTRVIQDSSSTVCTIAIEPGRSTYALHPSIFAVRRVRLDGQREPLELVDTSQLDAKMPGWDDPTLTNAGTPRYAVFDFGTGQITVVPTPAVNGTLRQLVWRGPTDDERFEVADMTAEPPLPHHMRRELKHWVAAQCVLNQDAEQRNTSMASEQMQLFDSAYGRKPDLHEIRLWSTNRRRHVTAHFD